MYLKKSDRPLYWVFCIYLVDGLVWAENLEKTKVVTFQIIMVSQWLRTTKVENIMYCVGSVLNSFYWIVIRSYGMDVKFRKE